MVSSPRCSWWKCSRKRRGSPYWDRGRNRRPCWPVSNASTAAGGRMPVLDWRLPCAWSRSSVRWSRRAESCALTGASAPPARCCCGCRAGGDGVRVCRSWPLILSPACLLAACASLVAAPPLDLGTDPAAVLAIVRQREDAMHSLRVRFSATVRQGETERRAEGVLLVKKPDRFRLRLLSPFGFTVFDYVMDGSHTRMELPLEGKRLTDDEIGNQSAFSPIDLRQAFLRGGAAFPVPCTPRASGTEILV